MAVNVLRGRLNFQRVIYGACFVWACYITIKAITPGEFSNWSNWSDCSVSCGGGLIKRNRTCTNPVPGPLGMDCSGIRVMTRKCNEKPCAIDGGYSPWSEFTKCAKSCGVGTRMRSRTCTNPLPQNGGRNCQHLGDAEEKQYCNVHPCPVNGGYSEWGKYTECVADGGKACGKGNRVRIRTCNNPEPKHKGKQCEGPAKETAKCEITCPTLATTVKSNNTATNTLVSNTKST